jgi:hypothetical protein
MFAMTSGYKLKHWIDQTTGNLYYFGLHDDEHEQLNFVASPLELSAVDNMESSMCVPGYGSVYISSRVDSGTSGESRWLKFAATDKPDTFVGELGDVAVQKVFVSDNNKLYLEIDLSNKSGVSIVVDELAVSVPVNNNYTEFRYRPEYMYEKRVYEHVYPGNTSGYQLMQRLNGEAPIAYAIPVDHTAFEHTSHLSGTTGHNREGIPNHSWPGVSVIHLHAKGYMDKNGFKEIMGAGSVSSIGLLPGQHAIYTIEMGIVESIEQFNELAVSRGKLVANASPSMVSPVDSPVTLHIYSRSDVEIAKSELYAAKYKASDNGKFIWEFVFRQIGEHAVRIRNAEGNSATVVFYITAPLKELIQKRADFIVQYQVYDNKESILDGAILCYSRRDFTGNHNYKQGLFVQEDSLWGNGSYEGGITEAMYLAKKNSLDPDGQQIQALEAYIQNYVRRYMQNPETYEVFWWCGNFNSTRSFDYMHLANVYYYMHFIAKTFQATSTYSAHDYLYFAYKTLMTMFGNARKMDMVVGNMAGQVMFQTLEAMEETLIAEYYELLHQVHNFQRNLFQFNVPYGSECAYDNTGYEMAMTMAERYDDLEWVKRLGKIILAARGSQPVWWWHGSDIRWWDAEHDFSEGCHHYTSPLNSTGLQKAIERGQLSVTTEHLSSVYGGKLGAFTKIHPDGSGSMSYCWEQESPNFGFHAFSGDIGLGLFGSLVDLGAYVYNPQDEAIQSYLCSVEEAPDGQLTVVPSSGAGNRITWHLEHLDEGLSTGSVTLAAGYIQSFTWNVKTCFWEAIVYNDTEYSYQNEISFKVPVQAHMKLTVNGIKSVLHKISDVEVKASFTIASKERLRILLEA